MRQSLRAVAIQPEASTLGIGSQGELLRAERTKPAFEGIFQVSPWPDRIFRTDERDQQTNAPQGLPGEQSSRRAQAERDPMDGWHLFVPQRDHGNHGTACKLESRETRS